MEIGDKVIFYTHQGSDRTSGSLDQLAFCTGIVNDETIDVAILPVGGPVLFRRVQTFDPDCPDLVPGDSYWRPAGSAAPDFNPAFRYSTNADWIAMTNRHKAEFDRLPPNLSPEDREKVVAQQKAERDGLRANLDKQYPEAKREV